LYLTLTGEPSANYHIVQEYAENHEGKTSTGITANHSSTPARIGLYYHFESSWSYKISVSDRLKYPDHIVDTIYKTLYDKDEKVDILYTSEQITTQELLIVPFHIIYDSNLEAKLIQFVECGGRLLITEDFFRKNMDNVFLSEVPKIFKQILNWNENNFISDSIREEKAVLLSHEKFEGQTWCIKRDCTTEDWQQVIETVLNN
jgi:beta-galactosidase